MVDTESAGKRVVIFGSTGLVGHGVLLESLDHPAIGSVLTIGRRESEIEHEKLRHLVHGDFMDFEGLAEAFDGLDACFWCLGISSTGLNEVEYTKITHGYTMAAAKVLLEKNPELCMCFVSGAGTDESEKGRSMWARVKGRAENDLRRMFSDVYLFRPAYIRPMRGARSKTALYRAADVLGRALNPLLRATGTATSTVEMGKAMIAAATGLGSERLLDSKGINALAATLDA